jgi:hypothetical protein
MAMTLRGAGLRDVRESRYGATAVPPFSSDLRPGSIVDSVGLDPRQATSPNGMKWSTVCSTSDHAAQASQATSYSA